MSGTIEQEAENSGDVGFAKSKFSTALAGFGSRSAQTERAAKQDRSAGIDRDAATGRADELIPDAPKSRPAHRPKPVVSSVEERKKAERAAANVGRRGGKPKKSSTVGMRCTTRQKMILLALQDHLEIDTISDAAVYAILAVAAGYNIKGAVEELEFIEGERASKLAEQNETGD